jgi:hypothetical protein
MGTALTTDLTGRSACVINLDGKKALDLATTLDELKIDSNIDWTFGTGVNQANLLFHDRRSTDDTGETLDLYASGSLVNAFGDALTMEAIKLLYIKNTHATLTLEIFGGVSLDLLIVAATSDILELPPGGTFLWTCPTAAGIVTSTNKNLKLASKTAGTITYDVAALGLD